MVTGNKLNFLGGGSVCLVLTEKLIASTQSSRHSEEATGWATESWFIPSRGVRYFSSPKRLDRLWG